MAFEKTKEIIWKVVDDEVLLLDTASAYYFSLNETGSEIWKLLDSGKTAEEVTEIMAGLYETERETIRQDIDELIVQLQSEKILVQKS